MREDDFQGQGFVRKVKAEALASKRVGVRPSEVAKHYWGKSDPQLVEWIRANEVAAGGTLSGEWGAELAAIDGRFVGDFIEYLHSQTVFDQLALRPVPANVAVKGQDGAATGYWVGQGKAIPATALDTSTVDLRPLKVAALTTITNELLEDSSPAADQLLRDQLVEASSQRVDGTFLSTSAAVNNVSPAGVLNGLSSLGSNGTDFLAVAADLGELLQTFIDAKNAGGELNVVMAKGLAQKLALMRSELGVRCFPEINRNGGNLEGIPVKTGDNVSAAHLILLKPSDIWRIGDSGVSVEVSREATIEMNSVPTGDALTPAAQTEDMVNMFQSESTAIKVVRRINFQKRRSSAVAYIADARYGTGLPTD